MNITTKFDINEEVYFLSDRTMKVTKAKVYKIETEHDKDGKADVKYFTQDDKNNINIVNEIRVFKERQELIDSL